jgi:iron-sulfur cluster assembly accessory protein
MKKEEVRVVTITDIAAEKAKEILISEGKEHCGLRIFTDSEGGCCGVSYGIDIDESPVEGDQVLEKNGLKLFIDTLTSRRLTGMEIDFVDNEEGSGFVIKGGGYSCGHGCSSCE